MARLKEFYVETVVKELADQFKYKSIMEVKFLCLLKFCRAFLKPFLKLFRRTLLPVLC